MFSTNGEGIRLSADVDYSYANDWMLFALWYSMQKLLPDAEMLINCKPPQKIDRQVFSWCKRCNIPFSIGAKHGDGILIPPDIIMVREIPEGTEFKDIESMCSDCREESVTPFVSYRQGCGNFVESEWINTIECPFPWADRFMTHSASSNEVRVLKLWKQLNSTYATVSRG